MWDYLKYFKKDLEYIGELIKYNNLRVDAHPDQFNVINSDSGSVVKNIGSAKGGKDIAADRFIHNLKKFPKRITNRLILENDDKTFNAKEVLRICEKVNLPMVFDVHHHNCNNCEEDIKSLLPKVFKTWGDEKLPPKIHFSSPREFEKDRRHADYIDAKSFLEFIYNAKESVNKDFDIMIEAKKKDITLNTLVKDLKNITKEIKFIDSSTFEI